LLSQDKGQASMIKAFVNAAARGHECPIPIAESIAATAATLAVLDSLRRGQTSTVARTRPASL
jgi:hypothetical protein